MAVFIQCAHPHWPINDTNSSPFLSFFSVYLPVLFLAQARKNKYVCFPPRCAHPKELMICAKPLTLHFTVSCCPQFTALMAPHSDPTVSRGLRIPKLSSQEYTTTFLLAPLKLWCYWFPLRSACSSSSHYHLIIFHITWAFRGRHKTTFHIHFFSITFTNSYELSH